MSGTVLVVGGGPAGLMAAEAAARAGAAVTLAERMPSVGRKLLLAGRSGLNLTHAEPFGRVLARYGEAAPALRDALEGFPPERLRAWAAELGQETFVGSSGRVFPVAWKASPLLRAWLARLAALGVAIRTRHRWTGFGPDGALHFDAPDGPVRIEAGAAVLALGGASWPRLGSDGTWVPVLREAGFAVAPLRPSNVALRIAWSDPVRSRFAGEPLKRVALRFGDATSRGDAVVTEIGLEGGAVYPVSAALGEAAARGGEARLVVDLRPDLDRDALAARLARRRPGESTATLLRRTGFAPVAGALAREAGPLPADPPELADRLKRLPLRVIGTDDAARAISSAGGLALSGLDGPGLAGRPGVFAAGEMLDWDAPTGGYLLQACFATGHAAGEAAARFAATR